MATILFCFVWLWSHLYHLQFHVIYLPIFFRVVSHTPRQDCRGASEASLNDMGKLEHNQTKHNEPKPITSKHKLCAYFMGHSVISVVHKSCLFAHILQGCFTGSGAALPQCLWRNPDRYGKIPPILVPNICVLPKLSNHPYLQELGLDCRCAMCSNPEEYE